MASSAAFHRDDGTHDEPGQDSGWNDWVAASRTFNFCCDDPLLDWLEAFGEGKGYAPDHLRTGYDARTDFRVFLTERAKEFESVVTDYLAKRHQLVRIRQEAGDVRTRAAVEATWAAMSGGAEIIAQSVLWNPESRTYGAPDLLIRSDVLWRLFPSASVKPRRLSQRRISQFPKSITVSLTSSSPL
jgi:hypothetical protein